MIKNHADPKVNDNFLVWLNSKYGKYDKVEATRGKVHQYLEVTFTCGDDEVNVNMREHIKTITEN